MKYSDEQNLQKIYTDAVAGVDVNSFIRAH